MTTKTKRITIERTYQAPIEDVWELWTTKEGIESWWGPDGFRVKVRKIDLRPGGDLKYAMIAIAPQQIEFMKRAGMPLTTEASVTYVDVVPRRRLEYTHRVDFIPGVDTYDVATTVELHAGANGVRLVLILDAMHDEQWTQRAVMGWESELGKLAKVVQGRAAPLDAPPPI
jgi:uncharacterized protein YndB with AHSA1/START domain